MHAGYPGSGIASSQDPACFSSARALDREPGQTAVHMHVHVDTKWKAGAHLTFAATDEMASFLRFLLLDTAVPMLAWKQRRSESGSFQKKGHDAEECTKGGGNLLRSRALFGTKYKPNQTKTATWRTGASAVPGSAFCLLYAVLCHRVERRERDTHAHNLNK